MPGVKPGEMNSTSDYGRFGPGRAYTNGLDPYKRDDPYRDEMRGDEDPYRRSARNGAAHPASQRFNNDHLADQSSLSDFNSSEPAFELDHLATFAAGGARKGTMHVEDGLRKLRQMENTTGIWTMRCIVLVERRFIVILDKNSGEELERFPVNSIQEPTAIFKNDRREIYNNLVLFTVMEDGNKKDAQADMHIFQSVRTPAQNIVDEIVAAKRGQARVSSGGYKIPPPPSGPAPEPPGSSSQNPYDFGGFRETIEHRQYNQFNASQYGASQFNNGGGLIGGAQRSSIMARPSYLPYKEREDQIGSNELLDRDVQLMNHTFTDIEKFVARLQQAAESYKELEKRKRERAGKGQRRNASGDGMLANRARPPPAEDFVDIFGKFKLAINLLAKLKAHIHDPNAPELIHFLFTPLSLIYEASRDPVHGSVNLAEKAVAPVLTQEAKKLLLNCLTSKEVELWKALGPNWTTSKDEWVGYVPPYRPRFYDGWQPAPTVMDAPVMVHPEQRRAMSQFSPEEDQFHGSVQNFDQYDHDPSQSRNFGAASSVVSYQQNYRTSERRMPVPAPPPPPIDTSMMSHQPPDGNVDYLRTLREEGEIIFEVLHDREGKNQKELTVKKGDYLQVMDNSRNWWKVRNYKGETGYCPYTILKKVSSGDSGKGSC